MFLTATPILGLPPKHWKGPERKKSPQRKGPLWAWSEILVVSWHMPTSERRFNTVHALLEAGLVARIDVPLPEGDLNLAAVRS